MEYNPVCIPLRFVDHLPGLKKLLDRLPMLEDFLPSCDLDLVAAVAAGCATSLFCLTCIMSCCMDRHGNCCGAKKKSGTTPLLEAGDFRSVHDGTTYGGATEKKGFVVSYMPVSPEPYHGSS